jgi:glycosyltransferase involved in cell wall biosynthesis
MDQGGKIRTGNILRGLRGGEFELILASPAPPDVARHEREVASACDRFVSWPEEPSSRARRVLALADRLPVAVATDRTRAGSECVARLLAEKPDVAVFDFPHADVLAPRMIGVPSVMFTHNVEAEIFQRHAARAAGLRRLVWDDQYRKMRRFEAETLRRYDRVIAVSERDRKVLQEEYGLEGVDAIDTGVDLDFFSPSGPAADPPSDGGTVVFVATMSWAANVEGIHYLLDEVWPALIKVRPRMRAIIVGRNPPASLTEKVRSRGLAVTLTGFVDDIRPYVAQSDVYVIPLQVGSGTRIKAFEAMAMGRPVVSTSLGVEGLPVEDREHFLRADTAGDFASAILSLLEDRNLRVSLAQAARRLVEDRFSWSRIARQFEAICRRALSMRADGDGGASPLPRLQPRPPERGHAPDVRSRP